MQFFIRLTVGAIAGLLLLGAALVFGGDVWRLDKLSASLDIVNAFPAEVAEVPFQKRWPAYGGDEGGSRYSSLDEINHTTIDELALAWTYSTEDMARYNDSMSSAATEGTPILVGDALVFCTPFHELFAVDPGNGTQKWRFDPKIDLDQRPANQFVCRGIAQWSEQEGRGLGACSSRIFMGTNDGRLIAVDAIKGDLCTEFGDGGEIQIDAGKKLLWPGEFQITSPPVVINNTVIIGSAIGDNARREAPHGAVRAFDAITGAPKWDFDPIPRDENAPNAADWQGAGVPTEGHANVWAPMSVDVARGLVFLPTSSSSPDFYGGLRPGDNRYANSVVALNAETGAVVWSFQTVHHDGWDYDLPAQPGLYTVTKDGKRRDVVAQVTKTGFVFVLDRDTGEPVLPIEERATPQGGAPGEVLSPTQPFPVKTPPIVPNTLSKDSAFGMTWYDKRACRKAIQNARSDGLFTPPSERGTLFYPFTGGGANWGGAAYDATRNLLVVNMSNLAHHIQLIPSDDVKAVREVFHDSEVSPQTGAPYGMKRDLLTSPFGLPCTLPPWGVIAGIDLASGDIVWRKAIGTVEDLSGGASKARLGTPNFGGPVITAGGLVFIGATMDNYLRAINIETGDEVWKARLPAGGQATPMTYEWQGRQYVVIYAGGNARLGTKLGDQLLAFALPE